MDYLLPTGPAASSCIASIAVDDGFAFGAPDLSLLRTDDPARLRAIYRSIFISPGLSAPHYADLVQLVRAGGVIERFVALGGVAVIHVAGSAGDQPNVAPGGVSYVAQPAHNSEEIAQPGHLVVTGAGTGGVLLQASNFSGWAPTDRGWLANLPPDAVVILRNADGPSLIEYPYGDGKVLVSTLNLCANGEQGPDRPAVDNLLKYGRFFFGSARTPAATLTATPSPTHTPLPPTPTPSVTHTRTATPTATPRPGDVDGDGCVSGADIEAIARLLFIQSRRPVGASDPADANRDGFVSAADLTGAARAIGPGACP